MPRTPLADPQIASHCQPATMKLQLDEFLDIGASNSCASPNPLGRTPRPPTTPAQRRKPGPSDRPDSPTIMHGASELASTAPRGERARSLEVPSGVRLIDTPDFHDEWKPEALSQAEALDLYQAAAQTSTGRTSHQARSSRRASGPGATGPRVTSYSPATTGGPRSRWKTWRSLCSMRSSRDGPSGRGSPRPGEERHVERVPRK